MKNCFSVILAVFLLCTGVSCAPVGEDSTDGSVENDLIPDWGGEDWEAYWEDTVYPDGPEFGLGSRDQWQLSQDGAVDNSCAIPNDCGGCAILEGVPGTECDSCGGAWECDGLNDVVCMGGCDELGCSDGEREGFEDTALFPEIAGCSGAWTIAGLIIADSGGVATPRCGRMAGDDNPWNPEGWECSAADLCANGWRLCASASDISERTRSWDEGCGSDSDWPAGAFFAAAVSGTGDNECKFGVNDIFGCGSVGDGADVETCYPLNKYSDDDCDALPGTWDCGEGSLTTNLTEAADVTKDGVEGGGVLCCKERR